MEIDLGNFLFLNKYGKKKRGYENISVFRPLLLFFFLKYEIKNL